MSAARRSEFRKKEDTSRADLEAEFQRAQAEADEADEAREVFRAALKELPAATLLAEGLRRLGGFPEDRDFDSFKKLADPGSIGSRKKELSTRQKQRARQAEDILFAAVIRSSASKGRTASDIIADALSGPQVAKAGKSDAIKQDRPALRILGSVVIAHLDNHDRELAYAVLSTLVHVHDSDKVHKKLTNKELCELVSKVTPLSVDTTVEWKKKSFTESGAASGRPSLIAAKVVAINDGDISP